jgi:hypothetical protein
MILVQENCCARLRVQETGRDDMQAEGHMLLAAQAWVPWHLASARK